MDLMVSMNLESFANEATGESDTRRYCETAYGTLKTLGVSMLRLDGIENFRKTNVHFLRTNDNALTPKSHAVVLPLFTPRFTLKTSP